MMVVVLPGVGARAIKGCYDCTLGSLKELVGGPPMRCITPYSRSHAIYLWVNEEAREELLTRNFDVGEQFAVNPLFGPVAFTSWNGQEPQPLSTDQVNFVLEKLGH